MRDGLYWVAYKQISAGFIVKDNQVVLCSPILKERLHDLWIHEAVRLASLAEIKEELKIMDRFGRIKREE